MTSIHNEYLEITQAIGPCCLPSELIIMFKFCALRLFTFWIYCLQKVNAGSSSISLAGVSHNTDGWHTNHPNNQSYKPTNHTLMFQNHKDTQQLPWAIKIDLVWIFQCLVLSAHVKNGWTDCVPPGEVCRTRKRIQYCSDSTKKNVRSIYLTIISVPKKHVTLAPDALGNEDRGQTPTVFSSVNHLPGHPFCGLGSTILSKIERSLNVKRIQQNIEVKSTGQWGQNNHQLGGGLLTCGILSQCMTSNSVSWLSWNLPSKQIPKRLVCTIKFSLGIYVN